MLWAKGVGRGPSDSARVEADDGTPSVQAFVPPNGAVLGLHLSPACRVCPPCVVSKFMIDVELLGFVYHWGLDVNSITVIGTCPRLLRPHLSS